MLAVRRNASRWKPKVATEGTKEEEKKKSRAKWARDRTRKSWCRTTVPERQMLWEGGPQLKDFVGWFLDNSSLSKLQHRRFGRLGLVASDGHEPPLLALSLGSFSPKTHEKMAFTVTSSFSRRPIASAGGPLALLYLLRDGKICLEISTCRLAPFTRDLQWACLQLEEREPSAGLGHADYAMAWDRASLSQLSHQLER